MALYVGLGPHYWVSTCTLAGPLIASQAIEPSNSYSRKLPFLPAIIGSFFPAHINELPSNRTQDVLFTLYLSFP